jgi:hypothetical protein
MPLMLALLCLSRAAFEPAYSLVPPLTTTRLGEVGNWTLLRAAANLKTFIRLAPAHPAATGSVCSRIPTAFRDWKVDLELNAYGGTGGLGFLFSYAAQSCPPAVSPDVLFSVFVNTTDSAESWHYSPLHLNRSFLALFSAGRVCSVPARSDEENIVLSIEKVDTTVSVSYRQGGSEWDDHAIACGRAVFDGLPPVGYFTLSAYNGKEKTDDHDLYRIETYSLSESVVHAGVDYSLLNRKRLENITRDRRRMAVMSLTEKYLLRPNNPSFSDSLGIVAETMNRSVGFVSREMLSRFLNASINPTISKARDRFFFTSEAFGDLRKDLDVIGLYLMGELAAVATEMKGQMAAVHRDLVKYADILTAGGKESPIYKSAYRSALADMSDPTLNLVFYAICVVEVVVYGIFAVVRIRRTQGFKKAD